jgi:hypothetical protein
MTLGDVIRKAEKRLEFVELSSWSLRPTFNAEYDMATMMMMSEN